MFPDNLNIKKAKKFLAKRKRQKITITVLTLIIFLPPNFSLFILSNFFLYSYYLYFCKKINLRNQEEKEKFKGKTKAEIKKLKNLKQYK